MRRRAVTPMAELIVQDEEIVIPAPKRVPRGVTRHLSDERGDAMRFTAYDRRGRMICSVDWLRCDREDVLLRRLRDVLDEIDPVA